MVLKPVILLTTFISLSLAWGTLLAADTVRDMAGREILVPPDPRRIVALAPSITEIIFALEQQERLVGTTQFSNFPAEASRLPKVGSYVRLDLERIMALAPDLCFATRDGNPQAVIERLQ